MFPERPQQNQPEKALEKTSGFRNEGNQPELRVSPESFEIDPSSNINPSSGEIMTSPEEVTRKVAELLDIKKEENETGRILLTDAEGKWLQAHLPPSAEEIMSPPEVRLTENRLITFGFGPENFNVDSDTEASAIQKKISEISDLDLNFLRIEVQKYNLWLSSPTGQMVTTAGAMPDAVTDLAGSFGNRKRLESILRMLIEEQEKRKIGLLKKLWLVPKALAMNREIKEEIIADRYDREKRNAPEGTVFDLAQEVLNDPKNRKSRGMFDDSNK